MLLVSVVVPTYRRPELLLRCLKSLINQTDIHYKYEIIVVSDGPDETTDSAINSLRPANVDIRFIQLPFKHGPAAARNAGWRAADGELIAFTDDDCIPDATWLSSFVNFYNVYCPKEAALAGRTVVPVSDPPTDYEQNIRNLETAEFITANCAITKSALLHVRGFDENFTMAWREDSELQFRLMANHIPLLKVESAVVTHPVRKAQWGVCVKEEKKGLFNALLYKKFPREYKMRIQNQPPWLYYIICTSFIVFLISLISGYHTVAVPSMLTYVIATSWFVLKRLRNTSKRFSHIIEMVVTSLIIPFLSLYYRFYGSFKYRVLLLP